MYTFYGEAKTEVYSGILISIVPKSNYIFENITCFIKLGVSSLSWEAISPNCTLDGSYTVKTTLDNNGYCKEHITLKSKDVYTTMNTPHPGRWRVGDYTLTGIGTVIKQGAFDNSIISSLIISGTILFSSVIFCITYSVTNRSKRKSVKKNNNKTDLPIEQS
jgi:hypothetical protein